jgi:hypothetical protein
MKSSFFWDITPYGPLKVNCDVGSKQNSACHLLYADFLFSLFFGTEDEEIYFSEKLVNFQWNTHSS